MKFLAFVLLSLLVIGCGESESEKAQTETLPEKRISKYEKLMAKYKDISFDTLEVFAVFDMDKSSYKFSGVVLDSAEMTLMPENLGTREPQSFFACYKFPMDASNVGLITRMPGQYSPTSVKLLVLDTKLDSIVSYFELSDLSGDAGDMWQKTAWLYKNGNQGYRTFLWQEFSHDHTVDDEPDSTVDKSNDYLLVDFSLLKPDTINTDTLGLTRQFRSLLNGRTPSE